MRRHKLLQRTMVGMSVFLAGGTVLGTGCMDTVASVPLCGTVFPWCTPSDQAELFYSSIQTPDYSADPTCTVPYACTDTGFWDGDSWQAGSDGSTVPTTYDSHQATGGEEN